ncbi:MAG: response regulator [bacterium]|nr:response regulator [bacterium]
MKKILIIEDSQAMINLLMKRFIKEGLESEFIYQPGNLSREEIVDLIIGINPSLIILDLKMPGVGGIAILEELQFMGKDLDHIEIPIVILTALQADESEIEFLKNNARVVDFVNKPIEDMNSFIQKIKVILDD